MKKNVCKGTSDKDAKVLFEKEDCIAYQIQNEEGDLFITEHHIFPGIWLCYKDAHMQKFTYPSSYPAGLLEINHCREGRFEYNAGEDFFYLSSGDMSVSRSVENGTTVFCPTRDYHGVTILIDPEHAPGCLSCFLDDVEVSPAFLLNKFCGRGQYFVMRSTARLEHIFSELYSVPEDLQKGYFKVKVLELLMFLKSLDVSLSQAEQRICSRDQVELAKNVCQYIHTHMDTRLTTDLLAEQFFVSPAQLKKCFYSVYGESIYAYTRACKMRSAARLLQTGDRPVSEIAGICGYDNSSKFSKAFRDVMGLSPAAYRKEYRLGVKT